MESVSEKQARYVQYVLKFFFFSSAVATVQQRKDRPKLLGHIPDEDVSH